MIHGKNFRNIHAKENAWYEFVFGESGVINPEDLLTYTRVVRFLIIIALFIWPIRPIILSGFPSLINGIIVYLNNLQNIVHIPFIPMRFHGLIGYVIAVALGYNFYKWVAQKPNEVKGISLAEKSLITSVEGAVQPGSYGVPAILGKVRTSFLITEGDDTNVLRKWLRFIGVECTTNTYDLTFTKNTTHDGSEVMGTATLSVQALDLATVSKIEFSQNSNVYVMLIDLLRTTQRTVINNLNLDEIDKGGIDAFKSTEERIKEATGKEYGLVQAYENQEFTEVANALFWKYLEKEYGEKLVLSDDGKLYKVTDELLQEYEDKDEAPHFVIKIGHLGIVLHKVAFQVLIATDENLRRAREESLLSASRGEALQKMKDKLKEAFPDLEQEEYADKAMVVLNHYADEFFVKLGSGGSSAGIDSLIAALVAMAKKAGLLPTKSKKK